ncbi:hypothetical protein H072_4944 [Dactylellina haptotyla CBS 200.50]|uniref:Uncharacterized protein n=1 Tax=Dactylellina haptotyla (strain CBS 200.50) TaxID=1284197 RepID=S8AIZ8_DACHA|nr:hypothetical protein H072_4944 [Dactylellina haptotyla CBS 200.50]
MPAIGPSPFLTPPTHGDFTLTLSKTIRGENPSYLPLNFQFVYNWNPVIQLGSAVLVSIGTNTTNQPMPQVRQSKHLSFMAKQRFWVTVDGKDEIYAYRVILDMDRDTGENKQAAMMIGIGANLIVGTENWSATELL